MSNKAACLAVLGTGSDVGKSIVVTALCRIFANQGLKVAPYKAQNMSNNSGVTPEGMEMGRAQIVQAEAARIPPHTDMNPVLLKPMSDLGSQVVLHGQVWRDASPRSYYRHKEFLANESWAALDRLRTEVDLVIMEGAGSCAEVNLMAHDIVNLRAAAHAQAPVILVADIDRGGVFAQIIGTLACLEAPEQERIRGFIVNRFRGDISLFQPGIEWIEQRCRKPVFGVLPWFRHFQIEAEDAVAIEQPQARLDAAAQQALIAVIRLPHISNFTDFDPLSRLPGCRLSYAHKAQALDACAAVILPGSKNTRGDLAWLHESGWGKILTRYAAGGGHILGICGGYQMLGAEVLDPQGLEGKPGSSQGLGLLPLRTELRHPKITTLTEFSWDGARGNGYEIHMGVTTADASGLPLFQVHGRNQQPCQESEGHLSSNGRILGTYLHGVFDAPAITRKWLIHIGLDQVAARIGAETRHGPAARDQAYELLAQHALQHLDMERIRSLLPTHLREARP